jgi:hypothetical protein
MSLVSANSEVANLKKLVSTMQGCIDILQDQIKSLRENKPEAKKPEKPDVSAPCDCCTKPYHPPVEYNTCAQERFVDAHRCRACKKLICDSCFHKELREFKWKAHSMEPIPFICMKCEEDGWEAIIEKYRDGSGVEYSGARRKSAVKPPKVHEEGEKKN